MPIPVTMPRLSDTMEAGTVIKWNVKEGDKVSAGDVIADVETDKATMEMSVYDEGTVAKLQVKEGQRVNVGDVIAVLAGEGEDVSEAAQGAGNGEAAKSKTPSPKEKKKSAPSDRAAARAEAMVEDDRAQPKPAAAPSGRGQVAAEAPERTRDETQPASRAEPKLEEPEGDGRLRVSPLARRLADEHGIDVRAIEGSGPGGRVIKRDVLKAIEAADETAASVAPAAKGGPPARRGEVVAAQRVSPAAPGGLMVPRLEERDVQLSEMRRTIAKRLVESKTTIPHYQVTVAFNMDALLELRSTLNEQLESQGVKLSVNDFLVRCCALAMYEHPEFNASWGGDHISIHGEINIGIAIAVPPERGGGLVVGVIRDADQKGLRHISYESKALADKARTRGLTIQDMSDSTFTISNLGMFGVEHFTAIINPPNSAILAVGAALKKPVVRNDQLAIGHEMSATLSCDHRVIDGAMAAQYLATLKELIENPGTLLV